MKTGSILYKAFMLVVIAAFISSCGPKTPEIINVIPADASVVVCIDGESIANKSGIDDFTQTKSYKKITEELSEEDLATFMEFKDIMKNPAESGVGINKETFMFVSTDGSSEVMVGFVSQLLDAEKFTNLLKTQFEKNEVKYEILEENGISILKTDDFDEDATVVWNQNTILFYGGQSKEETPVAQRAIALMKSEKETSVVSNKHFGDFYKAKKDISLWMNYESIANLQKKSMGAYGNMISLDFTDCYVNAYVSFEKGKVDVSFNTVLNEKMQELYKDNSFMKENLNTDILDYMPEPSLVSFAFGIKMKEYYNYMMNMLGETIKAQSGLIEAQIQSQLGMSLDEALDAIGGDLIVNLHGMKTETYNSYDYSAYYEKGGELEDYKIEKTRPGMPLFTAVLSINDEKIINVLLEQIKPMVQDLGGYYSVGDEDEAVFFTYHDKYVFVSSDEAYVKAYMNGEKADKSLASMDIAKLIAKKPAYMSFNMDLESYPAGIQAMIENNQDSDMETFKNMFSIYDKIEFIPEDTYSGNVILWMKNDKANSLQLILHNADESVAAME